MTLPPWTEAHAVFKAWSRAGMTKHVKHKDCTRQGHNTNQDPEAGNVKARFVFLVISSHKLYYTSAHQSSSGPSGDNCIPTSVGAQWLGPEHRSPPYPRLWSRISQGRIIVLVIERYHQGPGNSFQEDIPCLEMLSQALVLGMPVPRQRLGAYEILGLRAWRRLFWTAPLPLPLSDLLS